MQDFERATMTRRVLKKANQHLARRPKTPAHQQTALSVRDWVETATDFLINNNVDSLDIPNLCRRLGVTKGSFYWHFKGRADLLRSILDDWRKRMTLDVSVRAERAGATVEAALHHLLGLIRKPRPNRNSAIERSVREWARTDPITRAAVVDVDQMRLAFFEELFHRYGFPDREAHLRAYAAYALMMGDSILKDTIDPGYPAEEYVKTAVGLLLSQVASNKAQR
jgi:AcrR family transcriptional regulator